MNIKESLAIDDISPYFMFKLYSNLNHCFARNILEQVYWWILIGLLRLVRIKKKKKKTLTQDASLN